jgi:hypothetical protein
MRHSAIEPTGTLSSVTSSSVPVRRLGTAEASYVLLNHWFDFAIQTFAIHIDGPVTPERFRQALAMLVGRHQILRLVIRQDWLGPLVFYEPADAVARMQIEIVDDATSEVWREHMRRGAR